MTEVAVIAGSASDQAIIDKAVSALESYKISYEVKILSAHRDAEALDEYVKASDAEIFICIAGMSAALPGVVAARSRLSVFRFPERLQEDLMHCSLSRRCRKESRLPAWLLTAERMPDTSQPAF